MLCDKAIQTSPDDIDNELSENSTNKSESSDNQLPFYETMNESEQSELVETIYDLIGQYIEDYIGKMVKPDFHTELVDDVCHIVFQDLTAPEVGLNIEYDDMHSFVSHYCELWFKDEDPTCPNRHEPHYMGNAHATTFGLDEDFVKNMLTEKIAIIKAKDAANPKQRTKEWHECRYQMMTASNLWQTLSTDAQKNRFIYDKCKPLCLDIVESKWMSTEGSLHWGVKYEPLTTLVYEKMTGAKVGVFGCIVHPEYSFLGASPDGIVVNTESALYGRLVEIKNIYNREMDGVPSEAYWVQIQAQLACCDLDFCDFVETRFKEYESEAEYFAEPDEERMRGIILHMVPRDGRSNIPLYQYMPLDRVADYLDWVEETKLAVTETHAVYKTIYWYLDDIQMTTISRNQRWFDAVLPAFRETWDTIQKERISGYEHRAPKKRVPTETLVVEPTILPSGNICIIKLSAEDILSE
jgi:putative phage-type endonuclease